MKRLLFSLILPVYNEGSILQENIAKIVLELKKYSYDYEIIFVEDRSTDGSTSNLRKILPGVRKSTAIFHDRNMGRGKSVMDGIRKSKGEIVGFIDIDLEISEKYIGKFVNKVSEGFDLVVANRVYNQDFKSITRVIASNGYRTLVKFILDLPVHDSESGYKFFNRESIIPLLDESRDFGWFWDTEICALAKRKKLKIAELDVDFIRKPYKKSTVRLFPDSFSYLVKLISFKLGTST